MNTILSILFLLFFCFFSWGQSPEVKDETKVVTKIQSVNFTLENTTNKTISLYIPSVMNPNLSPNSQSGVRLRYGQKVFYRYKGKKRVLLVVNDSIKTGDIVDVATLLEKQKLEIDSKK